MEGLFRSWNSHPPSDIVAFGVGAAIVTSPGAQTRLEPSRNLGRDAHLFLIGFSSGRTRIDSAYLHQTNEERRVDNCWKRVAGQSVAPPEYRPGSVDGVRSRATPHWPQGQGRVWATFADSSGPICPRHGQGVTDPGVPVGREWDAFGWTAQKVLVRALCNGGKHSLSAGRPPAPDRISGRGDGTSRKIPGHSGRM